LLEIGVVDPPEIQFFEVQNYFCRRSVEALTDRRSNEIVPANRRRTAQSQLTSQHVWHSGKDDLDVPMLLALGRGPTARKRRLGTLA
jgi:hypothetical protein